MNKIALAVALTLTACVGSSHLDSHLDIQTVRGTAQTAAVDVLAERQIDEQLSELRKADQRLALALGDYSDLVARLEAAEREVAAARAELAELEALRDALIRALTRDAGK